MLLGALRVRVVLTAQADLVRSRPCIMICNHQSLIDGIVVALAAPVSMDYAVTPRYAVENRVTRWGLSVLEGWGLGRVVPLSPSRVFALRRLRQSLLDGRSVMIFPTGTISPAVEQRGYRWLSDQTGCPVVRASISGTDRSRLFARAGTKLWPKVQLTI